MEERHKEKIKVLHIHTRGIIGGSGTNTLLSMLGLPKETYEPELAYGCKGSLIEEVKRNNLTTNKIPHLKNEINIFYDFFALVELILLMRKNDYSIVHTHNSKAGILGRVAANICRVPIIIHTQHSCVFKYGTLNCFQKNFFFLLEMLAAKFTDKIIYISQTLRQEFINNKIGSDDKSVSIYSGIEIEKFKVKIDAFKKRNQLGFKSNDFLVGIVSRLEEGKGNEFVIKSIPKIIEKISNIKFIFVGDGPLRDNLEMLAESLGVAEKTMFLGLRDDVSDLLQIFDIVCLASLYEGMGRVLLEAQAAGRPVVATKVGGIVDIVAENKTAILVAPRDVDALTSAIIRLINDENLRNKMSAAAEEFVDYRFSSKKMVEDIISVYEELLKTKIKR